MRESSVRAVAMGIQNGEFRRFDSDITNRKGEGE